MPGAGHLVHMPSHIYMRTGNYAEAVDANVRAVAVDERYLERAKPAGLYPMMYYPHNIDFLWSAASMEGRSAETIRAARRLEEVGKAHPEMLRQMPDIEGVAVTGRFALARFGRWDEILAEPAPPEDLLFATGIHHYARGLAFVEADDGTTNAVGLFSPSVFAPVYGPGSADRFRALAAGSVSLALPNLVDDVDTLADLERLFARCGPRTQACLATT